MGLGREHDRDCVTRAYQPAVPHNAHDPGLSHDVSGLIAADYLLE